MVREIELEAKILIYRSVVQNCQEKLLMYAVSNIKDIVPEDCISPIDWLHQQVTDTIKNLEESYRILIELNYQFKQDK